MILTPDADMRNADWPKRIDDRLDRPDLIDLLGEEEEPGAVTGEKSADIRFGAKCPHCGSRKTIGARAIEKHPDGTWNHANAACGNCGNGFNVNIDRSGMTWDEAAHPRGQPENAGQFAETEGGGSESASKEKEPAKEKKAPPGSQMKAQTKDKLRAIGMVGTFPPADVPLDSITIADLDSDPEKLKYQPLMSWVQTTKSGRESRQYRYTQAFADRNSEAKHARVQAIEPHIQNIADFLNAQIENTELDQKQREAAAIASIIRETGLRPTDGEESVKHGHFGISSLQARHLKDKGDEIHLDFIGKEGVRNKTIVSDPANVAFLKEALTRTKGKDFIFAQANSNHAIEVLKQASVESGGPEDIKLKDLRTLKATQKAREVVQSFKGPPPPLTGDSKKDGKLIAKAILAMSAEVAAVLNNQPTQSRDSYIPPSIFRNWQTRLAVPASG